MGTASLSHPHLLFVVVCFKFVFYQVAVFSVPSEYAPTLPEADMYHHPLADVAVPLGATVTAATAVASFSLFVGILSSANKSVVTAEGNAAVPEVALFA